MSAAVEPMRIAVVGLGVRGRQWASAVAGSVETDLAAVIEVRSTEAVPGVSTFPALIEAAGSVPLDGVVLATPPAAHRAGVQDATELGLPVLCEKPLAEDLDEAVSMVALADARGVPLVVGMNLRFLPVSVELRRRIGDGRLGRPMYATFEYLRNRDGSRPDLNDYPLTMEHPMLLEQAIHHLDLLRYVYDREVETVTAHTWNPASSGYAGDACVAVHLVLEGDLHVSYVGTWVAGTNRIGFRWRTDLERGVMIQRKQFGELVVAERVPGAEHTGPLFDEEAEPPAAVPLPESTPFVEDTVTLLRQFCAAARGAPGIGPSGSDHLRTLALVHACVASAAAGRTVDVASFADEHGIPGVGT